jgi:predicted transcriptional regulator
VARRQTGRIRTAEQLQVLSAPATVEVLEALQAGGPATAAELGPRLGRRSNSLHYHVRKLAQAGMVEQVDTRRSGARTEAVYDVTADTFIGPSATRNRKVRQAAVDAVAALLRLATRNFARAAERPESLTETGRYRNIIAVRSKAWLTRKQLAEVNEHVDAITKIFDENHGTQRGSLYAMTTVLTPLGRNKT